MGPILRGIKIDANFEGFPVVPLLGLVMTLGIPTCSRLAIYPQSPVFPFAGAWKGAFESWWFLKSLHFNGEQFGATYPGFYKSTPCNLVVSKDIFFKFEILNYILPLVKITATTLL